MRWLQRKLERWLVVQVVRSRKTAEWSRTKTILFRLISKLEFKLRNYLYERRLK